MRLRRSVGPAATSAAMLAVFGSRRISPFSLVSVLAILSSVSPSARTRAAWPEACKAAAITNLPGGAWERDDITFTFFPRGAIASVSDTRSGWTVGIGAEYAFTNWITGFVEYDYYNFGTNSDNFVCGPIGCFGQTFGFPVDIKETKNVFKVGLNFLWGAGQGPAIGRY